MKTQQIKCYIYHEGEPGKGANDVCSFLKDYLQTEVDNSVKKLRIFSENCRGHNKNNAMVRFLMSLVEFKKMLNRAERFYTVQQYIELLCASLRKFHMFQVMKVARHFIIDFKTWCPRFYKKTCLSNDSYGRAVLRSQK